MGNAEYIGARVRRLLHFVVVTATAAMLALPMLLGPGATGLVRALGGAGEHHCACGMVQGKCGCPECETLAHDEDMTRESLRGHALLRSSCDDGSGMPAIGALPFASVPMIATLPGVGFELRALSRSYEVNPSLERARPPTPPPRRIAA